VLGILLFTPAAWSVLMGMLAILLVLVFWLPDPLFFGIWAAEVLILAWTHRLDFRQGIHLRPWIGKLLSRLKG
jgi:hypothetical protein